MIRCTPPIFIVINFEGSSVKPAIMAGISNVITQKARVRRRCRYSRRTIRAMLRSVSGMVFPHHLNKDFFQRRLD